MRDVIRLAGCRNERMAAFLLSPALSFYVRWHGYGMAIPVVTACPGTLPPCCHAMSTALSRHC
jgi:hypothetical protein